MPMFKEGSTTVKDDPRPSRPIFPTCKKEKTSALSKPYVMKMQDILWRR
jgi:hypothetical protein